MRKRRDEIEAVKAVKEDEQHSPALPNEQSA